MIISTAATDWRYDLIHLRDDSRRHVHTNPPYCYASEFNHAARGAKPELKRASGKGHLPEGRPSHPYEKYKKEGWVSWPDPSYWEK